ncbi:double-stranded RNA-binding protein 4-like [Tripterygium wilfordii]|uniref:double-stranded RNA-binding protein 4-like n=1 Tax=Tripterygium wilfordii TaxID=458696 RepID=UPI0018F82C87|nr:double-stranded RNA-binding protein 4-like [Tripterygium wilfordii]
MTAIDEIPSRFSQSRLSLLCGNTHIRKARALHSKGETFALTGKDSKIKMNKGLPQQPMYKNRLQEYAQKSRLPLPVYCIKNEGYDHAPKFRASVSVGDNFFESRLTFSTRKVAEQDVAKLAIDSMEVKTKDEGCAPIYKDLKHCKSILHEFSVKMNWEHPKYTTIKKHDKHPVFISSLLFDGITYTSDESGSKKEAEQLAASATIETLLGSGSGVLRQIINSKTQTVAASQKLSDSGLKQQNLAVVAHQLGQTQNLIVSHPLPKFSKQGYNLKPATPNLKHTALVNSSWKNKRKFEMGNHGKKIMRNEKQ